MHRASPKLIPLLPAIALVAALLAPAALASAAEPAPAPTVAPIAGKPWGHLASADGKLRFALTGPEALVGTDAACQVVLKDQTVSAQHAKITHKDGVVMLEDLGSKLGTLAAGTAVKKGKPFRILQPIPLGFGAVTLQFEFGERPALLPPTQAPDKGAKKGKPPAKPDKGAKSGSK